MQDVDDNLRPSSSYNSLCECVAALPHPTAVLCQICVGKAAQRSYQDAIWKALGLTAPSAAPWGVIGPRLQDRENDSISFRAG